MNISTKQKQTYRRREQTCGCQGGRMDWEFGVSRCKLLDIEWINNKVLLYSTGNYIQYPLIKHNGKEYEKEYTYRYNNHFAVHQKLTQYCKSTIPQLKKKGTSFSTIPATHT